MSNASNFWLDRWPGTALYPYTAEVIRDGVTSKMIDLRQAGENKLQLVPLRGGARRPARSDHRAVTLADASVVAEPADIAS